jgi:hypothetical protein
VDWPQLTTITIPVFAVSLRGSLLPLHAAETVC